MAMDKAYLQVMVALSSVIARLRDQQMWEIDRAKTGLGADQDALKQLREKQAPHWLESAKESYTSTSPMGMLYNYIMGGPTVIPQADATVINDDNWTGYWHQFISLLPKDTQDRTYEIMRKVDCNEALAIMEVMTRLEAAYRKDLASLRDSERRMSADDANEARKAIFAKYSDLVFNVDADESTKAAVAYQISYHRAYKAGATSVSFPWACCTAGLLHLLSTLGERTVPVPLRNRVGEPSAMVSVIEGVVVNDSGKTVGSARVTDGTYPTFEYDGRWFVTVPNERKVQAVAQAKTESVQFKLVGFAFQGLTASDVIERLNLTGGIASIQEVSGEGVQGRTLGLVANDELVGVIEGKDVFTLMPLVDTLVQITSSDSPTYRSGNEVKERKTLSITAQVTESRIAKSEVLAQCNRQASYWTCPPKSLNTYGIQRVRFQWTSGALPHKMTVKPGEMIARVFLNFGGEHDEIMTVELSSQRTAANGKPEIDIVGICPPSLANLELAERNYAVSSILAYTNYKHAELRVRFKKMAQAR